MTRSLRRIAAFIALAALVFCQLAVAAHACSQSTPQDRAALVQAPQGDDCCDKGNANVCERHCVSDASSVASQFAAPIVVAAPVPAWRVEPAVAHEPASRAAERPERRLEPPPLKLFGFLRI